MVPVEIWRKNLKTGGGSNGSGLMVFSFFRNQDQLYVIISLKRRCKNCGSTGLADRRD
jgi:hypothetical protein